MAKQDEFVMPVHFKRFMAATQEWTDEEVGCYFRLLMHQWGKKSIPKELHRQKRIADSVEKNHWIVEQKFKDGEEGLQNMDMEEIRAERILFSEKQRKNREGNNQNSTKSSPQPPPKSQSGAPSGEDLGLVLVVSNKDILLIREWQKKLFTEKQFLESACMNNKISEEEAKNYCEVFTTTKIATGDCSEWYSYSDYKRNFLFWIPTHIARLNYEKQGRTKGKPKSDQIDPATGKKHKVIA